MQGRGAKSLNFCSSSDKKNNRCSVLRGIGEKFVDGSPDDLGYAVSDARIFLTAVDDGRDVGSGDVESISELFYRYIAFGEFGADLVGCHGSGMFASGRCRRIAEDLVVWESEDVGDVLLGVFGSVSSSDDLGDEGRVDIEAAGDILEHDAFSDEGGFDLV